MLLIQVVYIQYKMPISLTWYAVSHQGILSFWPYTNEDGLWISNSNIVFTAQILKVTIRQILSQFTINVPVNLEKLLSRNCSPETFGNPWDVLNQSKGAYTLQKINTHAIIIK